MPHKKIAVYLVTKNSFLRESLARVLSRRHDLRVVGAAAMLPDMWPQRPANADVVLCDRSILRRTDSQGFVDLRNPLPPPEVVLFGMPAEAETLVRIVRAGARGYLTTAAGIADLLEAIRTVAAGQAVCPGNLCGALFDAVASEREPEIRFRFRPGLGLTRREQQVAEMLSRGLTNKEIAGKLFLSEFTVKNHVHRILKKLGVTGRAAVMEQCRDVCSYA